MAAADRSSNCPAKWDKTSTLVFRLVKGGRAVSVSPQYLTVDIRVHTDALQDFIHSDRQTEREVISLSWSYEADTPPCQSTITVQVKEPTSDIHKVVLNTLGKNGFQQLRQFANMMFREHETILISVLSPPVSFVCIHRDKASIETLANNVQELERKFKTYVLDKNEFSIELHIQYDQFPKAESVDRKTKILKDTGSEPGTTLRAKGDDQLNLEDLVKLEEQLRSQAEHIEAAFREQKRRNYAMRSMLRSVLESESEASVDLPATLRRDAGDGAEKHPSKPNTSLAKPAPEKHTSNSDARRAKLTPESQRSISPPSKLNTRRREPPANSQTLSMPNSKADTGNLTVSSESRSNAQKDTTKLSLQELQPKSSTSKQQVTSVNEQSNKQAKPSQAPARNKPTNNQRHSSSSGQRSKGNRKSLQDMVTNEESPPRAQGMDTFLCFHTTDKQETDKNTKQQMKAAALKYIKCLEGIADEYDIKENIALVAKDKNAWIKLKPTNDFSQVRSHIENLSLDYPTPLLDVLKTVLDFLPSGYVMDLGNGYMIGLRVVIISNHMTFCSSQGLFIPYPIDREEFVLIKGAVDTIRDKCMELLGLVMVGDADRKFLRELGNGSGLMCYEVADIDKMANHQLAKVAGEKMVSYFLEQGKSMSGNVRADTDNLVEVFGSHLDTDSQQSLKNSIRMIMISHGHGSDRSQSEENTVLDLPPLGSRVVRGADWKWSNQDGKGPGTVIEHRFGVSVLVEWDNGYRNIYRYGNEDAYDVKVVHDRPKQNKSNSSIDVGCEVVRGPDWAANNDEDGGEGNVGVAITSTIFGELSVRWQKNGAVKSYLFGREGKYEVMLRDTAESCATTKRTEDTAEPCATTKKTEDTAESCATTKRTEDTAEPYATTKKTGYTAETCATIKKTEDTAEPCATTKETGDTDEPCATTKKAEDDSKKESAGKSPEESHVSPQATSLEESVDTQQTQSPVEEFVWQWQDNGMTWRPYSQETSQKLEASYNRRPTGSCLVKRGTSSCRVFFIKMEEKDLEDNTRRMVQRTNIHGSY